MDTYTSSLGRLRVMLPWDSSPKVKIPFVKVQKNKKKRIVNKKLFFKLTRETKKVTKKPYSGTVTS